MTNNSTIKKFPQRLTINSFAQQFYLPGGNQTIIRKETLPKLQSSQDWLRNAEFNQFAWEQAKLELLQAESQIQQLIEQDRFDTSQKVREHPVLADRPQTRSLGLYKLSPACAGFRESA